MAAAGGAVNGLGAAGWRDGVRLAAVVREQGVAVDGLPRPSQPADHQGADAVGAGTVGRDRHSGPLELRTKAYRPVPHGQHRAAPPLAPRGEPLGQLGRRDRDRLHRRAVVAVGGGEDLAAAGVDHRQHRPVQVGMAGQVELLARSTSSTPRASASRLETPTIGRSWPCASARAVEMPSRRPVKPPGPVPTQMRPTSSQPTSAWASACSSSGLQRLGVARALAGRGIVAALDLAPARNEHRDRRGGRGGVDADDRLHGSISILRWSPPACASRTRCGDAPGRPRVLGVLGPLDERDRVLAEERVQQTRDPRRPCPASL